MTQAIAVDARRVGAVLLLIFVLGLTEWVGLVLLVPLLATAGVDTKGGVSDGLADGVAGALGLVGLPPTLPVLLAVFVAMMTLRALLQRAENLSSCALEQHFVLRLRNRLYRAISRTSWPHFSSQRSGDFAHALTADVERAGVAVSQLLQLLVHLVFGVAYTVMAVRLSLPLTTFAVVSGGLLLMLLRRTHRRVHRGGEAVSDAVAKLHGVAMEHMVGMKTTRSYGAEERNAFDFAERAGLVASAEQTMVRAHATSAAALAIGSALLLALSVYVAVGRLQLAPSAVLLLLLVFSRLVPRASAALTAFQHVIGALPSYANVQRLTTACEAAAGEPPTEASRSAVVRLTRAVQLRHVSFRYDREDGRRVIDDLTLDIPAGQTTAIVGASGAGKSTVADLVLGLLAPESGSIRIDDSELAMDMSASWRAQIGFVPQEAFLLHDTVRANLLWAKPDATEPQLWDALREASADGFVLQLPHGLDTVTGDRGSLLSGGERQRLALARALLRKPRLLVLDEATSSLDAENEQRIQRAIADVHGRTSVLIITHRLRTVREADIIHVMEAGRVVQSGTWSSLLADSAAPFYRMCAAQGALSG